MGVSPVTTYYSNQNNGQSFGFTFANLNSKSKMSSSETTNLNTLQNGYGYSYTDSLLSNLSQVFNGMGVGSKDSVTFNDMLNYRDTLRQSFEDTTKQGLREMGVDENVNFQVISDGNGGIKIVTNSEDKAKIDAFFAKNPALISQFNQIESLTNVEAARKSQNINVKAMRQRIEVESLATWFAGTGMGVGSILNFSGSLSSLSLLSGLNKKI